MDDHGASEFEQFLVGAWSDGRFLEFRVDGRLLGVAVTDRVERALSAVYTFYDPDESARGLGTFARSEEHTSELQSLMRISYAVFCLKKTPSFTDSLAHHRITNIVDVLLQLVHQATTHTPQSMTAVPDVTVTHSH